MRRMVTDAEIEKLGGTKLYKHVAYGDFNSQGDICSIKFELITTRKESLNGVLIDNFDNFISGTVAISEGEWLEPGFILSKGPSKAFYVPTWDAIARLDTSYTPSEGKFESDTVTEL